MNNNSINIEEAKKIIECRTKHKVFEIPVQSLLAMAGTDNSIDINDRVVLDNISKELISYLKEWNRFEFNLDIDDSNNIWLNWS